MLNTINVREIQRRDHCEQKDKPIIQTDQAEWKNQIRYKEKILYKDTKARFSVNEQTGLSEAED